MFKLDGIDLSWSGSVRHLVGCTITTSIVYAVVLVAYRLAFHPLAKFPGPLLARASYFYEFWYEVVCGARYTQQLPALHERYGPIIRISPDELHCDDPGFVDSVYTVGTRKRNKPKHYTMGWGSASYSAFGTTDHVHHRVRRSALNKFFSKARVAKIEDFIHQKAQVLCDKLLSYGGRGAFDATSAFNCFTTDTVTEYCFGSSTGFLEQDGWEPNCKSSIEVVERMTHLHRHIPWVRYVRKYAPLPLVRMVSQSLYDFLLSTRVKTPERLDRVEAVFQTVGAKSCPVFLELLNSDMPDHEKSPERLTYESNGVTMAGPATTAASLSNATYYLLSNPKAYGKLREELQAKIPDPKCLPRWSELEELPYLTAVIHESLRMLYDATKKRLPYETSQERLPRIATEEDLVYQPTGVDTAHVIPRGYAVGMSAYLIHSNEDLFPDAQSFIPERWLLDNGQRNTGLEKHMLAFSKGSRQCLGMQVAYCELYVAIAAVVLRVFPSLELCSTESADTHHASLSRPSKFIGNMVQVNDAEA